MTRSLPTSGSSPNTNGVKTTNGVHATPNELDASLLTTTLTASPRPVPPHSGIGSFDRTVCTDHMITVSWSQKHGWETPELRPYGPLEIHPTASVLHYATSCFEGLKLYRGHDGALRLFRPDCNCNRFLNSANRIGLPSFSPPEVVKLIAKLCAVDGPKWLPRDRAGQNLYIRPTLIADEPALGVEKPKQALLYIILAYMPTMDERADGIKLLASEEETTGVRAWPGGHGWAKVGANYGPTLMAQGEARAQGFTSVLWLLNRPDGTTEVTEAGSSNFFVVWRNRDGELEVVTAPLGQRVILDGVTRRSVLQLARERLSEGTEIEKVKVIERPLEMREIEEAVQEQRMVEAFAAGTAFFISPISMIRNRGKELNIPMVEGSTGTYARVLKTWLRNIMFGKEKHDWAYVVEEEA